MMTVHGEKVLASIWQRVSMRATLLSALTLTAPACGSEDLADERHHDRGDIKVTWSAAPDQGVAELAGALRSTRMMEDIASTLDQALKFPRDLPVQHVTCGEENAFYDPNTGELSMCYELLTKISKVAYDPELSEQELGERVVGTWMFVFFHELGHSLIDMYDLPITGREEDSVDDFSTVLMIEAGLTEYALHAAAFWAATGDSMVNELDFADEHSLNQQRFYNMLCLVYGSDPQRYEQLVSGGFLPASRAQRCPAEYAQKISAWDTLLAPWSK